MGGPGSGMGIRWNTRRTKGFVHEYNWISAKMFHYPIMQGIPTHGLKIELYDIRMFVKSDCIEIPQCSKDGEWTLRIPLTKTKTNFGNSRYWMLCPTRNCQRRCGKLYLVRTVHGIGFLCRKCLNLAYQSQNRTWADRMIDKKWSIIQKLGSDSTVIHTKPKWMHWKTFYRLYEQVDRLDEVIMGFGYAKFSALPGFANSPMAEYFIPYASKTACS